MARLDADHGEIAANLAEPENDPGVRFLDGVPLTGASAIGHPLPERPDGDDALALHELLHSAPCDLAATTRAVAEFQRAITEKTA
ncbi:hypothetical protein [Nocardia sp. NPDC004123]